MARRSYWAPWAPGLVLICLVLIFVRPGTSAWPPTITAETDGPGATSSPDPLRALNVASLALMKQSREDYLRSTGPILIFNGETLILRHGALRLEEPALPEIYHQLKAPCHIPLALYTMLISTAGQPLSEPQRFALKVYRDHIEAARQGLGAIPFSPRQRDDAETLITTSLAWIDQIHQAGQVEATALRDYVTKLRPVLDRAVTDAARAQIDRMLEVLQGWKSRLTENEWGQLQVLVQGSQPYRKDNLAVQLLARLLGVPGEGQRITYAESIWEEDKALQLLAGRALDTQIGLGFFDDPLRMYRDLLGDAARTYLNERLAQ